MAFLNLQKSFPKASFAHWLWLLGIKKGRSGLFPILTGYLLSVYLNLCNIEQQGLSSNLTSLFREGKKRGKQVKFVLDFKNVFYGR
jgi:hypothetical protein